MIRLNPETNKKFRYGDIRKDGFIFDAYKTSVIRRSGYFAENWRSPSVFEKCRVYSIERKKYISSVISDFVNQYKLEKGCFVCGYKKEACALDTHHIDPKKKKFSVGSNRKNSYVQFEAVKRELKKCIILCANCHREITHKNKEKIVS